MKFKHVYKCQRCGVIYVDNNIRDSDDEEDFSEIQKHHCGQAEYGAADIIGYDLVDEEAETPPAGRFGRIARLIQRGLTGEAVSELRQMQREDDENNHWLPVGDAPNGSSGNIIPGVYYGYTPVHCASGLIRHNGTEWEWITCHHRGIGDAGQPTMFCPIPEAPDMPR